ncbi:hypothetical protein K7X08_005060 [Anisodus acutangulus]|uniref:Uncharacterized protein n=1 Tax=Anisodus acutangulus TaxID=402998 RepID=A0A9Q1MIF7_9SOLA|nr:hypothetical protein K7X08_005060 [Anisodus acutangulus]
MEKQTDNKMQRQEKDNNEVQVQKNFDALTSQDDNQNNHDSRNKTGTGENDVTTSPIVDTDNNIVQKEVVSTKENIGYEEEHVQSKNTNVLRKKFNKIEKQNNESAGTTIGNVKKEESAKSCAESSYENVLHGAEKENDANKIKDVGESTIIVHQAETYVIDAKSTVKEPEQNNQLTIHIPVSSPNKILHEIVTHRVTKVEIQKVEGEQKQVEDYGKSIIENFH